jgi:hypothetical protein
LLLVVVLEELQTPAAVEALGGYLQATQELHQALHIL